MAIAGDDENSFADRVENEFVMADESLQRSFAPLLLDVLQLEILVGFGQFSGALANFCLQYCGCAAAQIDVQTHDVKRDGQQQRAERAASVQNLVGAPRVTLQRLLASQQKLIFGVL